MTVLDRAVDHGDGRDAEPDRPRRPSRVRPTPRSPMTRPNSRALVGGFLVAASAVGLFVTMASSDTRPTTRVVAASRDLRAGTIVTAADLEELAVDVPEAARPALVTHPDAVVGTVLVNDVAAHAMLRGDDVVAVGTETGFEEVSFSVPTSRALGRAFTRGERVDVLATFEDTTGACTDRIVRRAVVADFRRGADQLGARDDVVFVLAVADPETARLLTFAADTATLSVVGTTTASEDASVLTCPQTGAGLGAPGTGDPSTAEG
jgi:SAF domain